MTPTKPPRRSRTSAAHRSTHRRRRTAWHLPFATLLREVAPRGFEVQVEVWLSLEPQRADVLILRRGTGSTQQGAFLFRRLWPLLGQVTVLEYKSPVRSSFRRGDLVRLVSYGASYHSRHAKNLVNCDELTLVLVVASVTPTLRSEIKRMGWTLEQLEGGYARIRGVMYPCYIVAIDDVCQEERSEVLRAFSRHPVTDLQVQSWLSVWTKELNVQRIRRPTRAEIHAMREELVERLQTDLRAIGIAPPELIQRIPPKLLVPNLPLDMLRAISPEYIKTLPERVQRKVQKLLTEKAPRAPRKPKETSTKEASPTNVGAPTTRRSRKAA